MRILDRYILKEVSMTFFFGIFAFSSVFIGSGTLYRIAEYITNYGVTTSVVIRLFLYSLPSIVVLTFPMSMLLATLLAFGRLSGSSEITAMKSGGVSFYRLAMPAFVLSFIVSLFAVAFSEFVVPQANNAYANLVRYEIQGNLAPKSQEHIILKDIKEGQLERLTYARRFDADTNSMYGISIQEFDNGVLRRVQDADKANWNKDQWTMYDGTVYDLSGDGAVRRTLKFSQQLLPISQNPRELTQTQKKAEEMTIRELWQQVNIMKSQFVTTAKLETELYQRWTIPMATFIFALVGMPLGMQPNRKSSSIGFGLSIIIIFLYYCMMTLASAIGQGGLLHPAIAAWIPNLTGLLAGIILIKRAAR